MKKIITTLIIIGLLSTTIYAQYPDMDTSIYPNVDLSAFAPFNPPVDSQVVNEFAPKINEWTRQNKPGDIMMLVGDDLSSFSGNSFSRDMRSIYYCPGVGDGYGKIEAITNQQCAIRVPMDLIVDDMYMLWMRNDAGVGTPVRINNATIWWIGPEYLNRGESFGVYGQNMILADTDICNLYIDGYGWISSISANPYKATFNVPNDLTNGTYTVWAHNGHGQEYGWSESLIITIVDTIVWDGPTYNVVDYGADGTDNLDDVSAFTAAFNAAKTNDNSTIYVPAGTYVFDSRLLFFHAGVPIRFKGDGIDLTVLKPLSRMHPDSMFTVEGGQLLVEDMTFEAGGHNGYYDQPNIYINKNDHTTFNNVCISSTNKYAKVEHMINVLSSSDIRFTGCKFRIGGVAYWFGFNDHVLIKDCEFIGYHDTDQMLSFGGSEISIENITIHPFDTSDSSNGFGWSKGRIISGGFYGVHNMYISGVSSTNLVARIPTYFQEPAIQSISSYTDGGDGYYYRTIVFVPALVRDNMEISHMVVDLPSYQSSGGIMGFNMYTYDQATKTVVIKYLPWQDSYIDHTLPYDAGLIDVVDQNSGEQVLFEGGNTLFQGSPTAVTTNTVTIPDYALTTEGPFMFVVYGRGLGQFREIESYSGDTITLKTPWTTLPDSNSRISIGPFGNNYVVYKNHFDAVRTYKYSASAGTQFTGGMHRGIIDNNIITECRSVFNSHQNSDKFEADKYNVNPSMFTLYQNNRATNALNGISIWTTNGGGIDTHGNDISILGHTFRNNIIVDIDSEGISVSSSTNEHTGMFVIDNNIFNNIQQGAKIGNLCKEVTIMNNSFTGNSTSNGLSIGTNGTVNLKNNTWNNFNVIYDVNVLSQKLATPVKYISSGD